MNILTKYYADVQSFPLSQARMGMFGPGRYSGFDQIIAGTGATDIPIKLKHSTAGLKQTDNTNTQTDYIGTVMTPHGVVINTTDITNLVIAKNQSGWTQGDPADTTKDRYDLVYLEFWWADESPGNDACIGIIQGTRGAGIPSLTQAKVQIALGSIYVPYGAGSFSDLTYTPAIIPYFAGREIISQNPQFDLRYARLNYPNIFNGTQNTTPTEVTVTPSGSYTLQLPKTYGNTFIINCGGTNINLNEVVDSNGAQFPIGTRLTLFFKNVPTTSRFAMSTDGHHPGFEWVSNLGVASSQYPIRSGYGYEIENYKGRTWRIVNAFDYISYTLNALRQQVQALQAGYITPTPFRRIPEYGSGEVDQFTDGGTSLNMDEGEYLRYRINKAGDLEITGQFGFQAVPYPFPVNQTWIPLFTLKPSYNPQRSNVQFFAYGLGVLDPTLTTFHKKMKLEEDGTVWVSVKNRADFGSYSVNCTISFASSAGGIQSENVLGDSTL